MLATGGTWDPSDRPLYFLAGDMSDLRAAAAAQAHPWLLLAVNELTQTRWHAEVQWLLDQDARVLLDSGVFWLAQRHARRHGLGLYETLALPPEQLDRWDWLWGRYRQIVGAFGDRLWGYVELDQGGRDRKRATRRLLEAEGLRPIPVYHPLSDGVGYFHELAEGYDRVCAANLVKTLATERTRLLLQLQDLRRQHPGVWVHLLGVTPDQFLYGIDAGDSADSSAWVGCLRFREGYREVACGQRLSGLPLHFKYRRRPPPPGRRQQAGRAHGREKAVVMAAVGANARQRNWQHHTRRVAAVGLQGGEHA